MSFLIPGGEILKERTPFKLEGRDAELNELSAILMRSKQNSVIMVGAGGVGISATVLGLQALKHKPDAPFDIVSKRMFWLNVDGLFSDGDDTKTNTEFQKILQTLKRTPDSILVIEDTRDFFDAMRNNNAMHFINSLNLAVKNEETQVILETREEDLGMVLQFHSDMRQCYTIMRMYEPANGALAKIVSVTTSSLVAHHGIAIDPDAEAAAIELTTKYRVRDPGLSRAQPERTITLLDRALSSYRLEAHAKVPEGTAKEEWEKQQAELHKLYQEQRDGELMVLGLEEEIEQHLALEEERRKQGEEIEKESQVNAFSRMSAGTFDSPAVAEIKRKIATYNGVIAEHKAKFDAITATINANLRLTRDMVFMEFSKISGISVNKLNEDEREKLRNLEPFLLSKVFGQNHAVHKLANSIKVSRAGRRVKNKPQASYMFLGPSGTGKTFLAEMLALGLFDDVSFGMKRFDMSEYMEKHAVARLIGAPPGYEGYEAGGILTNEVSRNPRRIFLFDEIEKAHDDVFNVFLQVLDAARLTDNKGMEVNFEESIIMMTTNIGQDHFLDESLTEEEAFEAAMEEVQKRYRAEFLNRFNGRQNLVCFRRLDASSVEKIVKREFGNLSSAYAEQGISISISDEMVKLFVADRYIPREGARGLPGIILSSLDPKIVDITLNNPGISGDLSVTYDAHKDDFVIDFKKGEAAIAA